MVVENGHMVVEVYPEICAGNENCTELCPGFILDSNGDVTLNGALFGPITKGISEKRGSRGEVVIRAKLPPGLRQAVLAAVDACPVEAIEVETIEGNAETES